MKNSKSIIVVGALAMACVAAAAQAGVSKNLQAIYAKMDALALKKDMAGLSKYLNQISTPDCVFISKAVGGSPAQTRTRDETMKQMTAVIPMIDSISTSSSHIDSIKMGTGSLVATVHSTVAMTTKAGQGGPAHKIIQKTTSVDTWVGSGNNWKLKSSKITAESISQDGKQIPTG